jgi:hypothetical protein
VELFQGWGQIGRFDRRLARRVRRLQLVHVPQSTARRVLPEQGLVIEGPPPREPAPRASWPDWLEFKPSRIWAYDFTCWTRARRASIAIVDVACRTWIAALSSAEQTSTQVEAFLLAALDAQDLPELAGERATTALRAASGERNAVHDLAGGGQLPLPLAISGNGPQMRPVSARELLAGIAWQSGRPRTPQDQAWTKTLSGHLTSERPHL